MSKTQDLVVKMTINSADFDSGLKNAKSSMKKMDLSVGTLTKSFAKFAGGLGAAVSVGNVFAKNMKEIETISDSVERSQKVLNETIKSLFTTINTNSFKGFIDGLKDVVKNAKNAYDALDNLGTYLNFSSVEGAKNQASQSQARYMIAAIKKGDIEGDIDFWEKELRRLQSEAEGIIDKEIKHYEEAINKSNKLLYSKFKGDEQKLQQLMDKYTGTADKNEAAQNRYAELENQRKEIARLWGKNSSRNTVYSNFMKNYGSELEFLEIIVKREKSLTEINKLLIAQENKKNQLYSEKKANLKYLSAETTTTTTTGGSYTAPSRSAVDLIPSLTPISPVTDDTLQRMDALGKKLAYTYDLERMNAEMALEWQMHIAEINSYADAINGLAGAFSAVGNAMGDTPFGAFMSTMGTVAQQIGGLINTYSQLVAVEAVQESLKAGTGIPFPFNIAMIAAAVTSIMSIISSAKSNFAGSFANGGIVGGNSYTGDRLFARVNSGEMILNRAQQAALFGNSGGNVHFIIEGSQLKGVLDNYDKISNL